MTDERFPGDILARKYSTGFALLEWRDGRIHTKNAFSVGTDSILWLGCLSKTITATAIMLLADRGELSLDDPLARFVPEASGALGAVTLLGLLSHSAGLPRHVPGWSSFFDAEWLSEPLDSVTRRIAVAPDATQRQRSYSSVGFIFLGRIVECVTSLEFGAFVAREIFAPLGMVDSFCINAIPASRAARVAPVLTRSGSEVSVIFAPAGRHISNSMPFAGFFSTTEDLARFMQTFLDRGSSGRLISDSMVAAMFREAARGEGVHQGLSWSLCFRSDGAATREAGACGFWHTSSAGSMLVGDRAAGAAAVILGQGVSESDLVPLRAVQWKYVERALRLSPTPRRALTVGG